MSARQVRARATLITAVLGVALCGSAAPASGLRSAQDVAPVLAPVPEIVVDGSDTDDSATGDGAQVPGAPLDPGKVAEALEPLLTGGALGSGPTPAQVLDAATGDVLFESADTATTPASTTKLVTAVSVLEALGPQAVISTRTAVRNPLAKTPQVILVGGGDPSLTTSDTSVGGPGSTIHPATLRSLAKATVRALEEQAARQSTADPTISAAAASASPSEGPDATAPLTVRVGYDDSLFTGPELQPSWSPTYPSLGIVAPVTALLADEGRRSPTSLARSDDPSRTAANQFATELERAGVQVVGAVRSTTASDSSVQLATVSSPTIEVLVERMLTTSDNTYAENLARLAAHASGLPASFDGVAQRGLAVLAQVGAEQAAKDRIVDGSGLSRQDALTPSTLTTLLRAHAQGPIASGLPVAGATGSLRDRFRGPSTNAAAGLARLKTGTLTGVVALAGFVSRPDGRLLVAAFIDGDAPGSTPAARAELDRAVATLVACDCAVAQTPSASPSQGTG